MESYRHSKRSLGIAKSSTCRYVQYFNASEQKNLKYNLYRHHTALTQIRLIDWLRKS